MPRPLTLLRVPLALAREINRLLRCVEALPVIGKDARKARKALVAIGPGAFEEPTMADGPLCVVCGNPIPMERVIGAAMRGNKAALYDTDRCRETARKRRYRKS